jgi:hypothetical protein
MLKCARCGEWCTATVCGTCISTTLVMLGETPSKLDALDTLMTRTGLDVDQDAAAAGAALRTCLDGWARVVSEEIPRTPDVDRQLSSASGQCALIAAHLVDAQPVWKADCVTEITEKYRAVSTLVSERIADMLSS